MSTRIRIGWSLVILAALVAPAAAQTTGRFATVLVPRARGPIPVNEKSHPFGGAAFTQSPIDLNARGYVEEEFLLNGIGNVYDWSADGTLSTRHTGLLYQTRILVRRPRDAERFSGVVLLDIANQGAGFDTFATWGQLGEHLLSNGHAYVALTVSARGIGALKTFDYWRYGSMALPRKLCTTARTAPDPWNRSGDLFEEGEEGVRWDIINQVGVMLKNKARPRGAAPMAGLPVEYVFASMQSAGDLPTYIYAIHSNVALASSGTPIFDGFLIKDSGAPRNLHACAPPLAADDPRRIIRNSRVPVIHIVAQPEVSPSLRRPDSDTPGDLFRRYEIPGASHFDAWHFKYFPSVKDLAVAGVPPLSATWTYPSHCVPQAPVNEFPQPYFFAGAFDNLERWVRLGAPPPKAEPIAAKDGAGGLVFENDEFGNARGGVRSPWVDVPNGTFHPYRTGPNTTPFTCADLGYWVPFSRERFNAIYGSDAEYEKRFLASVDRLAKDRWFTPDDVEKIKQELLARQRLQ
jgi:hypothetical protein